MSIPNPCLTKPEKFLNSPERILSEIKKAQSEVSTLTSMISALKEELSQHFENGDIDKQIEINDIKARMQSRTTYSYSEAVATLKKKEEINNIATKKITHFWKVY